MCRFRKGTTKDIETLESIRLKSIQNCNNYSPQELKIWKNSIPVWKEIIDKTIICEYDKKTSGFVTVKNNELYLLYVDPSFQNKGIGSKLVSFVESKGMKCDTNSNSEKILKKEVGSLIQIMLKQYLEKLLIINGICLKKNLHI